MDNAAHYLALPDVVAVSRSRVAPSDLMKRKDWTAVEDLAELTAYSSMQ